jgi:hypothetical protein
VKAKKRQKLMMAVVGLCVKRDTTRDSPSQRSGTVAGWWWDKKGELKNLLLLYTFQRNY